MERLECLYIMRELEKGLGQRFRKAYTLKDGAVKLKLDKFTYLIKAGEFVVAGGDEFNDYKDSGFTQKLRKELNRRILKKVEMVKGDRLFAFHFDDATLYVQVFGKGGLSLYRRDEELLSSGRNLQAEDSTISSLIEHYPSKPLGAVLVKAMGKKYAKAFLDKHTDFIEKEEAGKYVEKAEAIEAFIEEELESARPHVIEKDGKAKDYSLLNEGKEVDALSTAIVEVYKAERQYAGEKPEMVKKRRVIEVQKEKMNEYLLNADKYNQIGKWIFERSSDIGRLLTEVGQRAVKRNDEVKIGDTLYQILDINEKDKKVRLKKAEN